MGVNLGTATDFVWRNARLVDRRVFACRFLGASPDAVVATLRGYQNDDGGFGNALDPDLRGPASQPVHVDAALRILRDAGATAPEVLARACSYLLQVASPGGGVAAISGSVLDLLDALLSWSTWDLMRTSQGRSADEARAALAKGVSALLA